MPTYEYKCLDCGEKFECFQNMNDPELQQCTYCGGNVKRLIGAGAGIIFRGSGFYCTDYRDTDNKKKTGKSSGNGDGGESSSSENNTEKKPAAAAATSNNKSTSQDTQ